MQVLASQLHFLANKNAELAIPPLFWPVNRIKIGEHVALLSCPSIYFLFYGWGQLLLFVYRSTSHGFPAIYSGYVSVRKYNDGFGFGLFAVLYIKQSIWLRPIYNAV